MRKIRKKKLIPKYNTAGVVSADGQIASKYGFNKLYTPNLGGNTPGAGEVAGAAAIQTTSSGGGGLAGSIAGGIAAGSGAIANALGIEQGKAGQIISGIGSMVSAIPGIGQFAGPALLMIGSFTGGGGSVDETTGEVTEASGLTKVFGWGHDSKNLYQKSNRIKNAKVAAAQTENLKMEYANNPNVEVQPNVLAAEGGIMRKPVDALVSKGELIYNPETKQLSKVPGSNGKPNKADDVYARLYEGDVVISNSPTMMMANGKTPALNLETMVNKKSKESEGTVKAREAIIKKVVNWQEANKTEPQLYAMYEGGTDNVGDNDLGNNENELLNWLRKKTEGTVLGKTLNPPADGDNRSELEKVRDRMKRVRQGGSYFDDPYQFTFSPQSEFGNRNLEFTTDGVGGFKTTNKFGYLGPQSTRQLLYTPDISDVVVPNFDYTLKSTSQKTSANKSTPLTTTPTPSRAAWAYMHNPENPPLYVPEASLDPGKITNIIKPIRSKDLNTKDTENGDSDDNIKSTMNWEDLAYKAASILTPLFDREKVETTRLRKPTWYGIPVAVDALNELQDAQLGYALANYNIAQGGYTAGQQLAARGAAASNLARQRAAIHQWQTGQQNKNIAQNVASLNAHSNVLSEIENKEIDINDANRAAARSVERQRRAEAMKNWGQVLRDKNQQAMDDMRMAMIEPLLQYAYENPEVIKNIYNKRGK